MDIATIGAKFTADGAENSARQMDNYSTAADRAEKQTTKLTATQRAFSTATTAAFDPLRQLLTSINANTGALLQFEREQQAAAAAARQLAREQMEAALEARRLAQANAEAARAAAELASRAAALKASVDPLGASLDRVNREIQEATRLYWQGAINAQEYQHAITVLRDRLNNLDDAHGKFRAGSKLMAAEMINVGRQFADVGVMASMGMSPLMILITQGPQIADVFTVAASRGVTFSAALKEIAGSAWAAVAPFAPWIAAIAAAAAAVTGLVFWLKKEQDELYAAKAAFVAIEPAVYAYEEAVKVAAGASDTLARSTREAAETAKQSALDQIKASQAIIVAKSAEIEAHQQAAAASGQSEFGAVLGSQGSRTISEEQKKIAEAVERLKKAQGELLKSDQQRVQRARETTAEYQKQAEQARMSASQRLVDDAKRQAAAVLLAGATQQEADALVAAAQAAARAMEAEDRRKQGLRDATKAERDHNKELREKQRILEFLYQHGQDVGIRPVELVEKIDRQPAVSDSRFEIAAQGAKTAEAIQKASEGFVSAFDEALDGAQKYLSILDEIDRQTHQAAAGMADAWGKVGQAIGGIATALTGYAANEAAIARQRKQDAKDFADDAAHLARLNALSDAAQVQSKLQMYAEISRAAKGFFEEQSAAYKVVEGLEKAFRAMQFAESVKAMAQSAREAAAEIANALKVAKARGAAGINLSSTGTALATAAIVGGSMVGGKAGGALMGAGSGFMIGNAIMPGIGGIIGGALGFLGGLFGGGGKKRQEEEQRRQAEQERLQRVADEAAQQRIRVMELEGDAAGALAAQRELELSKMDASNRAMQERIWALEDEQRRMDGLNDIFSRFATDEEKRAKLIADVTPKLAEVGLTLQTSRADFLKFAQGIDVTTDAGRELLDKVIALAPAFDELTASMVGTAEAAADAFKAWEDSLRLSEQDARDPIKNPVLAAMLGASAALEAGQGIDVFGHSDRAARSRRQREEERRVAEEAAQAWAELKVQLTDATDAALRAGDVQAAIAAQSNLYIRDPKNASYVRDMTHFQNGEWNNAGANAFYARQQAAAALELLAGSQGRSISISNAKPFMEALVDTFTRQFSPENNLWAAEKGYGAGLIRRLRGWGDMAAPGLYGALDYAGFVSQESHREDPRNPRAPLIRSFGADVADYHSVLTGLQADLDAAKAAEAALADLAYGYTGSIEELDRTFNETHDTLFKAQKALDDFNKMLGKEFVDLAFSAEKQAERMAAAWKVVEAQAEEQVKSVFAQFATGAAALGEQVQEINASVARLTESIGRMNSITDLLRDGLYYASEDFRGSDTGQRAGLIADAAAIAAQVLTTEDARRAAQLLAANDNFAGLAPSALRDIGLMFEGLTAFDAASFENTFLKLNDAFSHGRLTQEQYAAAVNLSLDIFEGLDDQVARVTDAFRSLADELLVDDSLSALGGLQRTLEAQRQYQETVRLAMGGDEDAAGRLSGITRTYLDLAKASAGSASEYAIIAGRVQADLRHATVAPPASSPRLEGGGEIVSELQALRAEVAQLRQQSLSAQAKQIDTGQKQYKLLDRLTAGGTVMPTENAAA